MVEDKKHTASHPASMSQLEYQEGMRHADDFMLFGVGSLGYASLLDEIAPLKEKLLPYKKPTLFSWGNSPKADAMRSTAMTVLGLGLIGGSLLLERAAERKLPIGEKVDDSSPKTYVTLDSLQKAKIDSDMNR